MYFTNFQIFTTMCVIIVKKAGVELPPQNILNQANRANRDGSGFMLRTPDGKLYTCKTTNYKEFCKAFYKFATAEDDVVLHFRLATHGSVCAENCHPFSTDDGSLAFAHNGILPIKSTNNQTDSQILFDNVLAPAAKVFGLKSPTFAAIVSATIGSSKFAFLGKEEGLKLFGHYEKLDGLLCSNLRFLPYSYYNYFSDEYRNDDFYSSIFAEHNEPYKRKKFAF